MGSCAPAAARAAPGAARRSPPLRRHRRPAGLARLDRVDPGSRRPPPRGLRAEPEAPPRSLPARCGSRGSSPAGPAGRGTRCRRQPETGRGRRCDRAGRPEPVRTDRARSARR